MPAPILTFHLAFIAKDNAGDGGGDSGAFTGHQLYFSLVYLRIFFFFIILPFVLQNIHQQKTIPMPAPILPSSQKKRLVMVVQIAVLTLGEKNPQKSHSSFWNILIFFIMTQRHCWRWWCR